MKRLFKNKKKHRKDEVLFKLAVTPASVNISMLTDSAKHTLTQYLGAIHDCRPDLLPIDGMDETFYYDTIDWLWNQEEKGIQEMIQVKELHLNDYDRNSMFVVRSILYMAEYSVGSSDYTVLAAFGQDERMGWLLESVKSLP